MGSQIPSIGCFANAGDEYRVCPYFLPSGQGSAASGHDPHLHLVDVVEGSVYEQEGWRALNVNEKTDLSRLTASLSTEVDRITAIIRRARSRIFMTSKPNTEVRVEGKVCPTLYDTLNDIRATECLATVGTLVLGIIYNYSEGVKGGAAQSERVTELKNHARTLLEIGSRALAPSLACADQLLMGSDAEYISNSRAAGSGILPALRTMIHARRKALHDWTAAKESTAFGWLIKLPTFLEPIPTISGDANIKLSGNSWRRTSQTAWPASGTKSDLRK